MTATRDAGTDRTPGRRDRLISAIEEQGPPVVVDERDAPIAGAFDPPIARRPPTRESRRPLGALACVIATGQGGSAALSLLLCLRAARETPGALCCDAAGPLSRLCAYAGTASRYTLSGAAGLAVRERLAPRDAVATCEGGVDLLAAEPRARTLEPNAASAGEVGVLLSQARERYPLTVVDCGVAAAPEALAAYRLASHVVWVLEASSDGLADGYRAFSRIRRHRTARELVAMVGCHPSLGRVRPRDARALADERHAPEVICLPYLDGLRLPDDRAGILERWELELRGLARLTTGTVAR
jgi:hypothetical protein